MKRFHLATISTKRQFSIPRAVGQHLGVQPGDTVSLDVRGGTLVIGMGDDVVVPGRVLVCPGGRGKDVDPAWIAFVGQVHHRTGASVARFPSRGGEQ